MDSIEQKAKELVEMFKTEIATSDFHIPEFITGIPMADGSEAYTKALNDETLSLAKQCAIICLDEIIRIQNHYDERGEEIRYWIKVKERLLAKQ